MPFGANLMPGEDDWIRRILGGGGPFGGTLAAAVPAITPPATNTVGGGLFGKFANKLNEGITKLQTDPTAQLGLRVLANSGYSPQRRGLGEILGSSVVQNQQAQSQTLEDQLKRRYMEAQIGALDRKPGQTPFADVNPSQYTPESVAAFQKTAAGGNPDYSLLQYNPKATDSPSNIREYEYYSKLSPEARQQYLEMKRSLNPFALGEMAGGKVAFDKRTGNYVPLTTAAAEAAGGAQVAGAKTAAEVEAEKTAGAKFDLPRIEQNVTAAVDAIDKLSNHPGLQYITGMASKIPIIPGTSQAAASALADQVTGQTFLQAYNALRGGGAITEVEGSKATAAIGRLQRAQSKKDYQEGLAELKEIVLNGLARAKQQAGQSGAPVNTPAIPAAVKPAMPDPADAAKKYY